MQSNKTTPFKKDHQYFKFCAYGFLKNLRFYDAFLLLFFLENGISFAQIGLLYAAKELIINILEIPSGIIADTFGRKKSLIGAFGAYIVSFVVFYFSTEFYFLLVAILLYGVGDAFRSGTHKGMIMDYLKLNNWEAHKIDYYGNTRSWSQKGSAISALFAGFLVLYSGSYRFIYLFSIIPYLLNFANIATYPNVLNHSLKGKKQRKHTSFLAVLKNFFSFINNRKVFQVVNSSALHSSYLKAIKDYVQLIMVQIAILLPFLTTLDIKRKNGLIIGILYGCIYLLTSYASKKAYKVSTLKFKNIPRLTLMIGLLAGLTSGLFMIFEIWSLALVAFVVVYLIENARKPILTGILSNHVPNEILTSIISAESFYKTIITSVLAIGLGVIADNFGIGVSLMVVSSSLILLLVLIGVPKAQK